MLVLVAYASRHGATRGIAERIAGRLTSDGVPAEARPASEVRNVVGYDAFVVGGAAYMFHWLGDATSFVKRNRGALAAHPTWLFSSGPLGTDRVDKDGRDVLVASRPREFAEYGPKLGVRGEQVFFGSWDPAAPPVGMAERFMKLLPANTEGLPSGDFRDWPAIDAWADTIAAALDGHPAARPAEAAG